MSVCHVVIKEFYFAGSKILLIYEEVVFQDLLAIQSTLTRCIYQLFFLANNNSIALECSLQVDICMTNSAEMSVCALTSVRRTLRDTDCSIPYCFTRQTRGPRSEKK